MSQHNFDGPLRAFAGECRDCGRELRVRMHEGAEGGNTYGIHFRCRCGTTNWLAHQTSGSHGRGEVEG